ncbi:unnamed protein product [Arabidopsis halleri]
MSTSTTGVIASVEAVSTNTGSLLHVNMSNVTKLTASNYLCGANKFMLSLMGMVLLTISMDPRSFPMPQSPLMMSSPRIQTLDHEDQVEMILQGLPEEYKSITDQVEGRDTPPTLTELHEKLINHESKLLSAQPLLPTPVTSNTAAAQQRNNNNSHPQNKPNQRNNNSYWQPQQRQSYDSKGPRPYQGRCQICGVHGHSARRCSQWSMQSQAYPPSSPTPWQPRALFTSG